MTISDGFFSRRFFFCFLSYCFYRLVRKKKGVDGLGSLSGFLLFLEVLFNGFPGGGTSLLFSGALEHSAAVIPEFTALAGSSSFTIQFWFSSGLPVFQGFIFEMVTPEAIELFSVSVFFCHLLPGSIDFYSRTPNRIFFLPAFCFEKGFSSGIV